MCVFDVLLLDYVDCSGCMIVCVGIDYVFIMCVCAVGYAAFRVLFMCLLWSRCVVIDMTNVMVVFRVVCCVVFIVHGVVVCMCWLFMCLISMLTCWVIMFIFIAKDGLHVFRIAFKQC